MVDIQFDIKSNKEIASGIYEMTLAASAKLPEIQCGQFLNLEVCGRKDLILRRPFCICKFGPKSVTIVYAVLGEGTEAMSRLTKGTAIKALLPLGNGFWLDDNHKNIALLGGGLGVAPLASVAKCYKERRVNAYLGFARADSVILESDFAAVCDKVVVTTDDGSYGIRGYTTTALDSDIAGGYKPDAILTCGSHNMIEAVKTYGQSKGIAVYASLEARMGCGVGACLVRVCERDGKYARVCADGPVFVF